MRPRFQPGPALDGLICNRSCDSRSDDEPRNPMRRCLRPDHIEDRSKIRAANVSLPPGPSPQRGRGEKGRGCAAFQILIQRITFRNQRVQSGDKSPHSIIQIAHSRINWCSSPTVAAPMQGNSPIKSCTASSKQKAAFPSTWERRSENS